MDPTVVKQIALEVVAVFIAIGLWEGAAEAFRHFRYRDLDIGCDLCEKPLKLAKTPDKKHYLCSECMVAYLREHFPDMDPGALKRAYRRRKIKRGKKRRWTISTYSIVAAAEQAQI